MKCAVFEVDTNERGQVEQPPVPLTFVKLAVDELRRDVSAFVIEFQKSAITKDVLFPLDALTQGGLKVAAVDLHLAL
jgi:hypothetical protein